MSSQDINYPKDSEKSAMLSELKKKRTSIMIAGIIAYLLLNVVRSSGSIILPDVIDVYSLTPVQAGLFAAIFNYTYAAVSIPIGGLIDIIKPRKIMLMSYVSMILGLIIFSYSTHYSSLIISRALLGLGSAGFFPAFTKTVANWAAARDFPKYSGVIMSAASLGTVLSSTPLVMLITGVGMKYSHLILALGCLIICVAMFFVMHSEPESCNLLPQDVIEGREIQKTKEFKNGISGVFAVLRQPRVWFIVSAVLVSNIGGVGSSYAATYMQKALGFTPITSSNIILIVSIIAIFGGILQGWISTKFSIKASMVTYMSLIILSLVLHVVFLPKFTPALALLAMIPQRIGNAMAIACCQSMFRVNVTGKYYGTCVGLYNAVGWAVGSGIFVQIFAGYIDMNYSVASFQKAFFVTLIVTVILAFIGLLSKEEVIPEFAGDTNM